MMCIGEHGNVIKTLAVSSALFAQAADTATLAGAALYRENEDRLYTRAPQQGSGDLVLESGRK
jgi:hypothetical protein